MKQAINPNQNQLINNQNQICSDEHQSPFHLVSIRNLESIANRIEWENEKERINAMKANLLQLENMLTNSKYIQMLNAICKRTRKELAIDHANHVVNLMVDNVNSPALFRYSLVRIWYYLMNNFEFIVSFLTSDYENVTNEFKMFDSKNAIDLTGILFRNEGNKSTYISYVKVNDKIYRITTGELIILSVVRITQMWRTSVSEESVIVLSTHGIKSFSYGKIKEKLIKDSCADVASGQKNMERMINDGVLIIRGSSFIEKLKVINSLMTTIKDVNKVVSQLILNNKYVKMMIQESPRTITSESQIIVMVSMITSMTNQLLLHSIDMKEIISMAVISEQPVKLLNDVIIAYKSPNLMNICESIGVPFELATRMELIGVIPRVIDVVLNLIANYYDDLTISIDTFLKIKMILQLERCSQDLVKNFKVTSKWGTRIEVQVINMVIDFAFDKFIEPHFNGTFEFDLNKFNLVTQFL